MKTAAETLDAADHYHLGDARVLNYQADTMICMSTWAHFIGPGFAWDAAVNWLGAAIRGVDQILFETQYAGDGPGPKQLQNDLDFRHLVKRLGGTVERLGSVPVHGRLADRTVWRITRASG
jgi:hypothetical protein